MQLKLFVTFSILIVNFSCKSQSISDWKKASDWKIYKTRDLNAFKLSIEELKSIENTEADTIGVYIQNAEKVNSEPIWKGIFIASCKVNGTVRKVIFSNYGGFFYDPEQKQYYLVEEGLRKQLLEYLKRKISD